MMNGLDRQLTIYDFLDEPDRKSNVYDADCLWILHDTLEGYRSSYWTPENAHYHELTALMDEIERVYARDWPNHPPIREYRPKFHTRNAGRKKVFDESADRMIIKLSTEGIKPEDIAGQIGCSRSYVYGILRRHRHYGYLDG